MILILNIGFSFAATTNWQATPWTRDKAYHLASKTLFSPTKTTVDQLYNAWSAAAAVNILFPDPNWPDRSSYSAQINAITGSSANFFSNTSQVEQLYLYRFYKDPYEAKAKLFQVFEDTFSVWKNWDGSITPLDIWYHFNILYANSLWNYKTMVKRVLFNNWSSWDYAMGKYLDLLDMNKAYPNENYARELMQLFLMWEYLPYDKTKTLWRNYTEAEVASLAKLITWFKSWPNHTVYYSAADHNTTASVAFLTGALKSGDIFSFYNPATQTINSSLIPTSINGNNWLWDNVIDYIFSKRESAIALFLADKLYRFYVNDTPTQAQLEYIAWVIKANNFEIYPSVRTLLVSDMMYSDESMSAVLLKNPLDMVVWTAKLLDNSNSSKVTKIIFDNSIINALWWNPYSSPSIFGRPWFDQNKLFWWSDTINQWISYSTKYWYQNYTAPTAIKSSLDGLLWSGAVWDYNLNNFFTSYVTITWVQSFKTSSLNTYSWSITLSSWSFNVSWSIVSYSNWIVNFPTMSLTLYNGSSVLWTMSISGTIDLNTKTLTILSWTYNGQVPSLNFAPYIWEVFSWVENLSGKIDEAFNSISILSWNSLSLQPVDHWVTRPVTLVTLAISWNPYIKRDLTPDELISQLERYFLAWKTFGESIKTLFKTYLITDSSTNTTSLRFLPNDTTYKNTKIRWLISMMLAQPEFMLKSWHDKAPTSQNNSSSIFSSNTPKLVIVYMWWWYDWLNWFVKKSDYSLYSTYRPTIAHWLTNISTPYFYDLNQDWYASSDYVNIKPLFDTKESIIFNRIWAPNHSRAHDEANEWVSSNEEDADFNTDWLVWKLIKNESETSNVFAISSSNPFIYNWWKFIKVIWSSSFNLNNYSVLSTSEKNLLINSLTGIFSQRSYPWDIQLLYKDSIKLDQISKTAKSVLWRSGPWWNTKDQFDYVKMLMNNNIWKVYYISRWWYDTHNNQKNSLSFQSWFVNDVINFYNWVKVNNEVVVLMYSEFGRTIKENGSQWTDHGKWWGMILLTNIRSRLWFENNLYGDIQIWKEKEDLLSVWIDYRTVWSKIYSALYWISSTNFFWQDYNISDYIDTIAPRIVVNKIDFNRTSTTRTNISLNFLIDDKNFLSTEWSYINFKYGTNLSSLSSASRWTIDNTYRKSDNTYKIDLNNLNHNSVYYYMLQAMDNNYNISTYTWTINIPQIVRWKTLSNQKHTILYDYNNLSVNWTYSLTWTSNVITFASNVWTWGLTITWYDWLKVLFSSGNTQIISLISSGTNIWNGWFLLPMNLWTWNYILPTARFGTKNLTNMSILKLIKIWADSRWIWMRLNKPVKIFVPWNFPQPKYSVIYSEDWVNWTWLNSVVTKDLSWWVSFYTDRFSYFALVLDDDVPNQFTFIDKSGLVPNSMIESSPVIITWINTQSRVTVLSWDYAISTDWISWSSWTNSTWVVSNTNYIKLRGLSPSQWTKRIRLTVWWVYDDFDLSVESSSGWSWWWGWGGGWAGGYWSANLNNQYTKIIEKETWNQNYIDKKYFDSDQLSKIFDAINNWNSSILSFDDKQKEEFYSDFSQYSFHSKMMKFINKFDGENLNKLERSYMFFLLCYDKYKKWDLQKQDFKSVIKMFISSIPSTKKVETKIEITYKSNIKEKLIDKKYVETIWLPIMKFDNLNVSKKYKSINQKFESYKERVVANWLNTKKIKDNILQYKKDLEFLFLEWDRLESIKDYKSLKTIKNKILVIENIF